MQLYLVLDDLPLWNLASLHQNEHEQQYCLWTLHLWECLAAMLQSVWKVTEVQRAFDSALLAAVGHLVLQGWAAPALLPEPFLLLLAQQQGAILHSMARHKNSA